MDIFLFGGGQEGGGYCSAYNTHSMKPRMQRYRNQGRVWGLQTPPPRKKAGETDTAAINFGTPATWAYGFKTWLSSTWADWFLCFYCNMSRSWLNKYSSLCVLFAVFSKLSHSSVMFFRLLIQTCRHMSNVKGFDESIRKVERNSDESKSRCRYLF